MQNHSLQLVISGKKRRHHSESLLSLFKFTNAVNRHVTAIPLRWVYETAISTAHSCYATATLPPVVTLELGKRTKIPQGKLIFELHPFLEPLH